MKWIIYLIILLNIGFFAWHFRTDMLREHPTPVAMSSARLVLLSEYEAEQAKAPLKEHSANGATLPVNEVIECMTLGPFADERQMQAGQEQVTASGYTVNHYLTRDKLRDGFWVMLDPEATAEATKQRLASVKKAGIKEYFLILKGEYRNAISLGLFSKPDLAKRRLDTLVEKGFKPRIVQVTLPKREYWLEWVKGKFPPLNDAAITALRALNEDIGQTARPCVGESAR